MPLATLTGHQELTLAILSPRLKAPYTNSSIKIGSSSGVGQSEWTVTLTRMYEFSMKLSLYWRRTEQQVFTEFRSLHIVPRSNFFRPIHRCDLDWIAGVHDHVAYCTFDEAHVLEGENYVFDVVLSTDQDLARTFAIPQPMPVLESRLKPKNLLSQMLKDANSVDVCFTFTSDKTCSHIGLWAHRCILLQYEAFVPLIQEAKTIQSLVSMALTEKEADGTAGSDRDPVISMSAESVATATTQAAGSLVDSALKALVINVDNVSLATFCVMLQYIYTGEINRSADPTRFVLSDTNKVELVWRDPTGEVEDSVGWRPLDEDSPWRLKDVTWEDLCNAAVQYDLEDLQAIADQEL
ncbi:hypothetical protein BGX23_009514 [Mortierella sp. AD031]|nr:hypothetical protein BGX23_009514 [Mortierella sp. AD031]